MGSRRRLGGCSAMAKDYPHMVYPAKGLPFQVSAPTFEPSKPRLRFRPRTGEWFAWARVLERCGGHLSLNTGLAGPHISCAQALRVWGLLNNGC